MAEAHPVGFRYPMQAKEKGATLIHVDPRFTRTSACCDHFVSIRTGSDLAFLGGLINYVLSHDRWFKEYVSGLHQREHHHRQAICRCGKPRRSLQRIRSAESRQYDGAKGKWCYENSIASESREEDQSRSPSDHGVHGQSIQGGASVHSHRRSDSTQSAPGKQIPERPHAPAPAVRLPTPEEAFRAIHRMWSRSFAAVPAKNLSASRNCCAITAIASARSAIVYAVGWTQHTTGVQIIRAAGILQLLLGNMGRPGGGIMAMRGHCSIQGSTDIPTLYDLLPGYLPQPACDDKHESLDRYCEYEGLADRVLVSISENSSCRC